MTHRPEAPSAQGKRLKINLGLLTALLATVSLIVGHAITGQAITGQALAEDAPVRLEGSAEVDASKSDSPKSGAQKPDSLQSGTPKSGAVKSSAIKSGAAKQGVLKQGPLRSGPLKSGAAKAGDGKGRRVGSNESSPAVTPEREAAVRKFVEQHHPELVGLLESLKTKNSTEYERAVRDLFRVSERLAQFYGRDGQRYELELKLWQSQSRLDLLAARFKMSNNDDLREQIQQALDEQYSLRQSLIRLERDRVAERLKKLDDQLQTFDASRDELLDRQLRLLLGKQKAATGKGS